MWEGYILVLFDIWYYKNICILFIVLNDSCMSDICLVFFGGVSC